MAWARIALLDAAGEEGDTLEKVADIFGYQPAQRTFFERKETGESSKPTQQKKPELAASSDNPRSTRQPARFIRVKEITYHQTEHSERPAYLRDPSMKLTGNSGGSYSFSPPSQLLPLSRLLPFLLNNLGQQRAGSQLDHRRITRNIAQGKALHKLPHLPKQRWPQRVQVIVDTSEHLEPYWDDFAFIVKALQSVLGKEAVESVTMVEETMDEARPQAIRWPVDDEDVESDWLPPRADMPVLILSDLGVSARQVHGRVRWRRFAKRLHMHPADILTLSPASQSPNCMYSCKRLQTNPLNDSESLSRHALTRGFRHKGLSHTALDKILTQLSPLPLIDAGLLRRLRLALAWGGSEIEGQIWNHPNMVGTGLGIYLHPDVSEQYRKKYVQEFSKTDIDEILWKVVNTHHKNAFEGLRHFEGFNHASLGGHATPGMLRYMQQLAATTAQAEQGSRHHAQLIKQCKSFLSFSPESLSHDVLTDLVHEILVLAYRKEMEEENWQAVPLNGVSLEKIYPILTEKQQPEKTAWHVKQIGDQGQLTLSPASTNETDFVSVFELPAFKHFPITAKHYPNAEQLTLHKSQSLVLGSGDSLSLKSSLVSVVLESITKPSWASSISYSVDGLRASISWGDKEKFLYWHYPHGNMESKEGSWNSEDTFGYDEFGLYGDLAIAPDLIQRFRWIEPGTFEMGSSKSEPERSDRETQHQVTLTQGYWLADTTVTQVQWQAVTGENPSDFKGENLPVENVSWDDSQNFINKLKKDHPHIAFQLPSEAQWEYACRAGTVTPFSFGVNITPEQVNYDGNYPYDNGKEGQYRKTTVPVRSLLCNQWGLYEMHGNVWEWCRDSWQDDLGSQSVTDPESNEAGAGRVVRGGSWGNYGRSVRSACRYHYSPAERDDSIGLRLSFGHPSASSGGGAAKISQSRPAAIPASRVAEQRQAGLGDGLLAGVRKFTKGLFGSKNEK